MKKIVLNNLIIMGLLFGIVFSDLTVAHSLESIISGEHRLDANKLETHTGILKKPWNFLA